MSSEHFENNNLNSDPLLLEPLVEPFNYEGQHTCPAVVIGCIDFRIWRKVVNFVEKKIEEFDFDFLNWPGATRPINDRLETNDFVQYCLQVPCDLHHVQKIILANHRDCGAYEGSKRFDNDHEQETIFHFKELALAKQKLQKLYPNIQVITVYVDIITADNGAKVTSTSLVSDEKLAEALAA